MLLDFEIARCTRRCAASGQAIGAGERYYSTLHMEHHAPVRRDYSAAAWQGPPADCVAWWQSRVADGDAPRARLAPQDVLVNLFSALAEEPAEVEFRYVLGLLLLRRRIVKLEATRHDQCGEVLVLDCPRREEQFEMLVAPPSTERTVELEKRLGDLLYGGGA
jgi:hypothetical protein